MTQAFQIVSVDRSLTNWGHHHVTAVGTAPKPGFVDTWPMSSVLKMLATGDIFYTVTSLGDPAFARSHRCWCGYETVRTTPVDDLEDGLEGLPVVDMQASHATPVAS